MLYRSIKLIALLAFAAILQGCSGFAPKALPNPENYFWTELPYSFDEPVNLTNAGDGSGRLLVLEKKEKFVS